MFKQIRYTDSQKKHYLGVNSWKPSFGVTRIGFHSSRCEHFFGCATCLRQGYGLYSGVLEVKSCSATPPGIRPEEHVRDTQFL